MSYQLEFDFMTEETMIHNFDRCIEEIEEHNDFSLSKEQPEQPELFVK